VPALAAARQLNRWKKAGKRRSTLRDSEWRSMIASIMSDFGGISEE